MDLEKIAQAIEADAGTPLPDLRQALREARDIRDQGLGGRITTAEQVLVRSARQKLGMSQAAFAEHIRASVATVRDWEQGRHQPPGPALCLFRLLVAHPELAVELVES